MSLLDDADPRTDSSVATVEKPSGKGARDENFPVGSFLIANEFRPDVQAFYAFARAIDDIADDEELTPQEKITRLGAMDAALRGEPGYGAAFAKAHALRERLKARRISTVHGSDLVAAFVKDCRQSRYQSWDDLVGYCALSANPVGRFLLDLHGEERAGYRFSDALCTVLQVVNHLQDCGDDRRRLDRVYIIESWLKREGGSVTDLDLPHASHALSVVKDEMLDHCEMLMRDARQLPAMLKSRRLAMESAVIVRLAHRLIQRLRHGDPLATRIDLTKFDFAVSGVAGALSGFISSGKRMQ